MRVVRRRVAATLLTLALGGTALGACGTGGASTATLSPECPGKAENPRATTITWWVAWANPKLTNAARQFNCEHPDLRVKITLYPAVGDDRQGKLMAATVGKNQPNLVLAWNDPLAKWATQGMLQPLDDVIGDVGIAPKEFAPEAWDNVRWRDRTYGVPVGWDPDNLLWYNKKIFADAGLDPERPPRTWAEFEAYAAKIDKVEDGTIKRLGFIPWAGWEFNDVALGQLFDAGLDSGRDGTIRLDTPGMRTNMEWWARIARKHGGASKVNGFTQVAGSTGAAADPLVSGRVGMTINGDWQLGMRPVIGPEKFEKNFGVALMPPPPGGRPFLAHSGWSFMMPRGAGQKSETMRFVRWMLDDDRFAKYFGESLGWMPAKLSARDHEFYTKDPMWRRIFALNERAGPERTWLEPSPVLAEYFRALAAAEEQVINLKKTPAEALAEADANVRQLLAIAKTEGAYGN